MVHHQNKELIHRKENHQQNLKKKKKKSPLTEWEKVFANHIPDKGLWSKCAKNPHSSTTKS